MVPPDRFLIAESGIRNTDDLRRLAAVGPKCYLVGESLMRQTDVAAAVRALARRRQDERVHSFRSGRQRGDGRCFGQTGDVATATARARVVMPAATLAMIQQGSAKKGDVLGVARLAGIMAAKRTAELIPLCHPSADFRGKGRSRGRYDGQCRRHHRDCAHDRPNRRGDGSADRGQRGCADGL